MGKMRSEYTLHIRPDDNLDGMLIATVEELPGVFASGLGMDELMEAVAEAIVMVEEPDQEPAAPRVDKARLAFA